MQITINITTKQEKFLKKVYGNQPLNTLFQMWFVEWLEKRVNKDYIPTKTLDDKIDEIINK